MKTNEIREMSVEELETKLAGLKDELFNLFSNGNRTTGQSDENQRSQEIHCPDQNDPAGTRSERLIRVIP